MENNLFQLALDLNETNGFFKGEGKYFSHNPMDSEHCYGVRLSGDLNNFLDGSSAKMAVYNSAFELFLCSLEDNYVDFYHFLSNLSEIQRLKVKGIKSFELISVYSPMVEKSINDFLSILDCNEQNFSLAEMYVSVFEKYNDDFMASALKKYLSS